MPGTIYIKTPQCIEVENPQVLFKDFLKVYCDDTKRKEEILQLPFYTFDKNQKQQLVISILKVIEKITTYFPDCEIENLGEGDFILSYQPKPKHQKMKQFVCTLFICMVAFFGGGYAIMAYNTDVGAKELFSNLSLLFLGNAKTGVAWITICYSIGLATGMILFFNHLGNKKINSDPTPLEIQMRLYEQDIGTTIIKDISRRGENMDVKE